MTLEVHSPVARALYQLWSGEPTAILDPDSALDPDTQLVALLDAARTLFTGETPSFVLPALDAVEAHALSRRYAAACEQAGIPSESFDIPASSTVRANPWLRLGPPGPAFRQPQAKFATLVFSHNDVLGQGTHAPVIVHAADPAIHERLQVADPHDQILLLGGPHPQVEGRPPCGTTWPPVPTELVLAGAPS